MACASCGTPPTKTANRPWLALDDGTLAAIEALRAERERYGPWMFGRRPELVAPDRLGWWWRRARAMAGIDRHWRVHDLRHWSGTVAIGEALAAGMGDLLRRDPT